MKRLMSAASLAAGLSACVSAMAASPRDGFVRDFDGDGRADLLWQSPTRGTGAWLMNGTAMRGAAGLVPPAPGGASLVFTGDFDGDGRTDILWRGTPGDRHDVTLMNGLAAGATAQVSAEGSGWEAVGTGDFDNDGKTDILWKNAAGDFRVSFMNGTAIRESAILVAGRPDLSVAAIADIDGDGRSDILWSAADGSVLLSTMSGARSAVTRRLIDAGSGWAAAFTGDFDGDGHADIVWRHADGRHALWLMNDPLHPVYAALVDAGTGWSVKLVRDFNGDGRSDLLWSHADGSYAAWLMQGASPTAYSMLLGAASGWTVVAADDYDGDGKDDLLWRDAAGAYAVWLMDGLAGKSFKSLLAAGSDWDAATAYEGCDRTRPGSFTIVGSSPLVPATGGIGTLGTKLIHVQRTPGTCGGAYTVNFNASYVAPPTGGSSTGYSPLASGSLTFADGEPGIKSIAVATGSSAGTYTLGLTSAIASAGGKPTTASGSYALAVTAIGVGTTNYLITATNAQQFYFGTSEAGSFPALKPGEWIAAAFVYQPTPFTPATLAIAQVTNQTFGGTADIEIAIASTPGRFPGSEVGADTLCSKRMGYPGTAQTVLYAFDKTPNVYCQLNTGQTYYINVRQVSRNYADGSLPSCTNSKGCALRVQPQNLN